MKRIVLLFTFSLIAVSTSSQTESIDEKSREERNKEVASSFYRDLWATDNTDNYSMYLADKYVVHDIGNRKGVTEPSEEQKIIADRFWDNGSNEVIIDYQIADGDLVATRWIFDYEPETFFGKIIFGTRPIPIINVFRIEDGKIVEIWNHRHDIDTNQTMRFTFKGLLIGLVIALVPTFLAIRMRRKIKKLTATTGV